MILFAKIIKVDLRAERKRIRSSGFTEEQQKKLLKLCDLVEAGHLRAATKYIRTHLGGYSDADHCREFEFIGMEIIDLFKELRGADWFNLTAARKKFRALKLGKQ